MESHPEMPYRRPQANRGRRILCSNDRQCLHLDPVGDARGQRFAGLPEPLPRAESPNTQWSYLDSLHTQSTSPLSMIDIAGQTGFGEVRRPNKTRQNLSVPTRKATNVNCARSKLRHHYPSEPYQGLDRSNRSAASKARVLIASPAPNHIVSSHFPSPVLYL